MNKKNPLALIAVVIIFWIAVCLLVLGWCGRAQAGQVSYDPWYYQDNSDPRFWLPDKYQHCAGSYALSKTIGPWPAFGLGLVKEIYDDRHAGGYSWRDLIANGLGIFAAEFRPGRIRFFPLYKPFKKMVLYGVTITI